MGERDQNDQRGNRQGREKANKMKVTCQYLTRTFAEVLGAFGKNIEKIGLVFDKDSLNDSNYVCIVLDHTTFLSFSLKCNRI